MLRARSANQAAKTRSSATEVYDVGAMSRDERHQCNRALNGRRVRWKTENVDFHIRISQRAGEGTISAEHADREVDLVAVDVERGIANERFDAA